MPQGRMREGADVFLRDVGATVQERADFRAEAEGVTVEKVIDRLLERTK